MQRDEAHPAGRVMTTSTEQEHALQPDDYTVVRCARCWDPLGTRRQVPLTTTHCAACESL